VLHADLPIKSQVNSKSDKLSKQNMTKIPNEEFVLPRHPSLKEMVVQEQEILQVVGFLQSKLSSEK
jgi:hypothetical protein